MGSLGFLGDTDKKARQTLEEKVMDSLKEELRPEFLNRIDEVVVFHALDEKEIAQIVDLQLEIVTERLAKNGIKIEVTEKAKDLIARKGYEPNYGARPLKRVIQNEILDELALRIIEKKVKEGDVVKIDAKGEEIVFE